MNKSFANTALFIALAAAGVALCLLCGAACPSGNSVLAVALKETALEAAPGPGLEIKKERAEDLVRDLDGDGEIDPGDRIRYTIGYSYTNTVGPEATGVRIVDDYDETVIASIAIYGEAEDNGDRITWELGTVEVGTTGLVTYEVTLKDTFPPGSVKVDNTVTIEGDGLASGTDTEAFLVKGPDLKLAKGGELAEDVDGDGIIEGGDTIRYTIDYINTGEVEATGVSIVDRYDQTLIATIADISDSGEHNEDDAKLEWNLGTVEAGEAGSVSYTATLEKPFPRGSVKVENKVTIASDKMSPVSVTNATLVEGPNLTMVKGRELAEDLDGDGTIGPGDTIRYTIDYENKSDVEATEVQIVDDYDEACIVSITGIDPEGSEDGDTITWVLGTVEAGGSGSVEYRATLGRLPDSSAHVTNKATISSAEMEEVTTEVSFLVKVVPPTPTPEPTPVLEGPKAGIFAEEPWQLVALLFVLGLAALVGLIYAGFHLPVAEGKGNERLLLILEGITVHLIICAVILLALGGSIGAEAAASILAAVAGYVFGRAKPMVSGE